MNYLRYLALAKNEAEKVTEDDKPSTRIKVSTLKIKRNCYCDLIFYFLYRISGHIIFEFPRRQYLR
jgi:hypothetical protein